ncbi:MAG: hypothetical protein ACI4CS_00710 [Candidatus Weimeria sp.]
MIEMQLKLVHLDHFDIYLIHNAWGAGHPEVSIRYIPIEEYPEAAAQRNILSAPTVCLYLNGKPALQQAGYFSLEEFLDKTERYLSLMYRS